MPGHLYYWERTGVSSRGVTLAGHLKKRRCVGNVSEKDGERFTEVIFVKAVWEGRTYALYRKRNERSDKSEA